ncbi:MAG: DNA polymerase III subunit delta [Candidatus Yanofskybacteria bacterium RIFCSPLOWO2_01_FULL_49_17]|uniref:DNA polymerase III subunit delta n=1 Tax=Candidatus Yanofskybacteria bacterium RIFCSPLOWO2_01_FULL_49_17 TaxID=1802700 RepID=A0A1F8GPW4_9BACT|nr:MAG: DNA polymerase III subunit delta [Candidatus Yanofskybacteria bacterium RIFCSPLOWO2_01_FULL_49_17]
MIIFLYGSDRYRLYQNRDLVVQKFKDKHGAISIQTVDGPASDAPAQFKAALSNNSFFNDIQLVIVRDIFSNPASSEKIGELLDQYDTLNDRQRIVVAIHPGPKSSARSSEVLKLLLNKKNLVREFEPLSETQFEKWLKSEARQREVSFAPGAAKHLMLLTGGDSWRAVNELEKLSNYSKGAVTAAAIDELVLTETEPEIFAFIDALGSRNKPKALELLYRELSLRQDPYYLLSMIIYQFRTLLMVRDAMERTGNASAIASETGLKPFVVNKMKTAAARYTLQDLRRVYQTLCDLELGAKQGTKDLQDSLYEFALSV